LRGIFHIPGIFFAFAAEKENTASFAANFSLILAPVTQRMLVHKKSSKKALVNN